MPNVVPIGVDESAGRQVQALTDPDWRVRRSAVVELVRESDHEAVRSVLNSIRDDHVNLDLITSAIQVLAGAGVDTTSALTDLLADPHPEARCSAALVLGLRYSEAGIPNLVRALRDDDLNVRFHVIEALGRLRAIEASDALIEIVETRDFAVAFAAIDALAKIGDTRVGHRLLPMLGDELFQAGIIDALGFLSEEDAIPALAEILNSDPSAASAVACSLLRMFDRFETLYRAGSRISSIARDAVTSTGVENLRNAVETADTPGLRGLVVVLGWLKNADGLLFGLIGHPEVGAIVAEQMVRKGPQVLDDLVNQLNNGTLETRRAVAIVLGRIGSAAAVPALLRELTDDAEMTVVAAGALAMIGDQRAYAPLLDLLEWDDPAIRRAAVSALNSLGHAEMVRDMEVRLRDERPHVRESAAKIVGYAGYPELLELLLQRCQDADEGVRRAAVESLPSLNEDPLIRTALSLALTDHVESVRAAAVRTLGQFPGLLTGEILENALKDAGAWVRYYAVRALARQQYLPALNALLQLAQSDPATQVRVAAVETLGSFGAPAAGTVLADIAASPDNHLACAAIMALGMGRFDIALPILLTAIDSDHSVRKLASIRALGALRRSESVPALVKAAANAEIDIGPAAIDALRRVALPEAVAALIELAQAPTQRDACVTSLAHCDSAHVAIGLSHPNVNVRLAVVLVLSRMPAQVASNCLLKGLNDAAGAVRYAALQSLVHSDCQPDLAILATLAEADPDLAIRRTATNLRRG